MKINIYAPVIIPTLCRYEHFKRCVDSLSKCTGADKTKLIIGLDYPAKKEHEEGYHKISEYIPTISGFEEIIVQKRDLNYGSSKNGRALYDYVYGFSDRCIFTEDDNEFSPNFLEYINKGLELYKDNPYVIGICGYRYVFEIEDNTQNAFPCIGFSAWGVGLWREKTFLYKNIGTEPLINSILYSWKKSLWMIHRYPTWLNAYMTMKLRHTSYGDFLAALECLFYDKVSIFPKISKVRNHGNDGTGVNCHRVIPELEHQPIDSSDLFEYDDCILQQKPIHLASYLKINPIKRVAILLRYLWFRLTGNDLFRKIV